MTNATEPNAKAVPLPERETLEREEVAALLGVSVCHIRRHPPVPPIRVGRRVLFPRAAVMALVGGAAVRTATLDTTAAPPAGAIRTAALRV